MKKTILFFLLCILPYALCTTQAAPVITQAEPLSWWTNMRLPLTLMLHGKDLKDAKVTISPATGLTLRGQHNGESPNYLFLDLDVQRAGDYVITLKKGRKTATYTYHIGERRVGSRERQSFTTEDIVYLIMSDRYVDGDKSNNDMPSSKEKSNKQNVHGRFGGDIAGIASQLDHIRNLGATAIWPTPMLDDNEAEWSYHGYACSDYYHIDPRYGTNESYRDLVALMHSKGLKMLMDMVPNHCGSEHWWIQDLPYHDWINQFPEFTNTINAFSTNYDINASERDRLLSNRGWFDHPMPDMNLENKDLLKYFQQWAIWWIEYADLDGLRVDTYPYIEKIPGALWLQAIREEYPNINIVGECWTRPASAVAYWQSGARNYDGFDSHLPTVMDFPLEEAIRQALEGDGKGWGEGLTKVYDAVSQDYLYADVNHLFTFLGNHDMDRIQDVVKDQDPRRVKLAYVLLMTMRGIPQIFAGDEYSLHSSDRSLGHSTLRMPLPLGSEVTADMQAMYDWQSHLINYRRTSPVLQHGKTMHFLSRDNTYAYVRYTGDHAVLVFLNASDEARTVPVAHYEEILSRYPKQGIDVLTGEKVDLTKPVQAPALSALVVEL